MYYAHKRIIYDCYGDDKLKISNTCVHATGNGIILNTALPQFKRCVNKH